MKYSEAQMRRINLLTEKGNGILGPDALVEDATPNDSPWHDQFEWNNAEAGHQYRVGQARVIIASIRIEREVAPERPAVSDIMYVRDPVLRGDSGYRRTDSQPAQEHSQQICAYYLRRALAALAGAQTRADALGCPWPITGAVEQIAAYLRELEGGSPEEDDAAA